jgi:GT2 family glycosyltransferase
MLATELVPKGVFQFLFRRRFPSRRWAGEAPIDVEAVVGAALFLRACLLRDVGTLPEDYFFFLEETDWCRAIRAAGFRVVHLPHVHVRHVHGATSKKRDPARTRIEYHRSLYRYFRKNRGPVAFGVLVAVRLAKSVLHVLVGAPAALLSRNGRERWRARWRVLVWHLAGRPEGWGLAPAGAGAAGTSRAGAGSGRGSADGQR